MHRRVSPGAAAGRARGQYPPASAIIAAYLPNEADTIVETVEAFLQQDYNQLQVILAYNTPDDLPVEDELRDRRARPPLRPMRVDWSTSKAQNVNAALPRVTGTFVAVFDADHHLAPGSFRRAWRWLSNGVDVVQGHCAEERRRRARPEARGVRVRGDLRGRPPGRARVHGFGIFGVERLLANREAEGDAVAVVHVPTEDIDSMRVLADGGLSSPTRASCRLSSPDS